jgi:hypothetical protein
MRTASFFTYTGPGRISIARFAPRGTPAGFRVFKALAPGKWFNSVPKDRYLELYAAEILRPLSPETVARTLHELAGGAEPVLLCWEKPPFTESNWCHRRIVADWLQDTLGLEDPRLTPSPHPDRSRAHRGRRSPPIRRSASCDGAALGTCPRPGGGLPPALYWNAANGEQCQTLFAQRLTRPPRPLSTYSCGHATGCNGMQPAAARFSPPSQG